MTKAVSQRDVEQHVEALIAPLARADDAEYIGEPISQLAHALQCADWAARKGAPEEVIIACLFHDVGHLLDDAAPQMDGLGVLDHETLGG
ncbi:MAG: phosphohydrolase, partial [Myxococcota bacterium]|nr:phosphohydrolase [Myxococcota bacterium]